MDAAVRGFHNVTLGWHLRQGENSEPNRDPSILGRPTLTGRSFDFSSGLGQAVSRTFSATAWRQLEVGHSWERNTGTYRRPFSLAVRRIASFLPLFGKFPGVRAFRRIWVK